MLKKDMVKDTKKMIVLAREVRDGYLYRFNDNVEGMDSMFRKDFWDFVAVTKALKAMDFEKAGNLLHKMDTFPREQAFEMIGKVNVKIMHKIDLEY